MIAPVTLDEADLVLVAAAALGADPQSLVDHANVAALARISARSEEAATAIEAGATVLLEIVHERPFPTGNEAAAWLAAVHLLDRNAVALDISDGDAAALVRQVAAGASDRAATVSVLEHHASPPQTQWRRVVRWLRTPRGAPTPSVRAWSCPTCDRTVLRAQIPGGWYGAIPSELVALCARQHGTHDRYGREISVARQRALAQL